MNIIIKGILIVILIGIPVLIYIYSPSIAIILGIAVAVFIFIGSLMDKTNKINSTKFSITHRWGD